MAGAFPPVRTEGRVPKKVLVELYSFDNAAYEITSTVDVSLHGARVFTKAAWARNQRLSIPSVRLFLLILFVSNLRAFAENELEFFQPVPLTLAAHPYSQQVAP